MSDPFEPVRRIWKESLLPGIEEGSSYGTPALKVRGKLLIRLREPGVVVLSVQPEEKELLMQADPAVYFQTAHYEGYPWVLVRLDVCDPGEVTDLLERAWRRHAGKKLITQYGEATSAL